MLPSYLLISLVMIARPVNKNRGGGSRGSRLPGQRDFHFDSFLGPCFRCSNDLHLHFRSRCEFLQGRKVVVGVANRTVVNLDDQVAQLNALKITVCRL